MSAATALGRAARTTALLGASAVAWAVTETRMFRLRQATVPVLPAGSPTVRLLHLSDLHLTPRQRVKRDWVRSLAELEPDVVVSTGDHLAAHDAVPAVLDVLGPLLERPGAFVFGSNDYFAPRPKNPARYLVRSSRGDHEGADVEPLPSPALAAAFRSAGWLDLTNRRDRLEVAGVRLSLVGVDDPHLDRDRFPAPDGRPHGDLHLGVSHAPYRRVLERMREDGCALVVAGHTHGGQLRVPGYGALVTNCDLDRGRAAGLHGWPGARPDAPGGEGSMWLHVSAGLGTSPYAQVRFACPPEATLVRLEPLAG